MSTRKLISFDWALKKLLRSKANFGILEGFLSELLRDDIRILEILDSESNKDDAGDKFNRVDLKVKNTKGEILIVEIQYEREFDYLQRILYAASRAIVEQMGEGMPYSKVAKVISINILYFDLGQGDDYIYRGRTRFYGLHKADELTLSPQQRGLFPDKEYPWQVFPEYYLIKVNQFDDIAKDTFKDTLDEWIYFLKNEEIKDEFSAKGLKEAKSKLDVMKLPREERLAYRRYLDDLSLQASMYESSYGIGVIEGEKKGREEGRKEGKEEGRKEGEETKARVIAKALKAREVAPEVIVEVTGLTVKEIEGL